MPSSTELHYFYECVYDKKKSEVESLLCADSTYANAISPTLRFGVCSVLGAALYNNSIDTVKLLILFGAILVIKQPLDLISSVLQNKVLQMVMDRLML